MRHLSRLVIDFSFCIQVDALEKSGHIDPPLRFWFLTTVCLRADQNVLQQVFPGCRLEVRIQDGIHKIGTIFLYEREVEPSEPSKEACRPAQ